MRVNTLKNKAHKSTHIHSEYCWGVNYGYFSFFSLYYLKVFFLVVWG